MLKSSIVINGVIITKVNMEYKSIINNIQSYITLSENEIKNFFINDQIEIGDEIYKFFEAGKRIRPALIFLVTKALDEEINEKTIYLATAIELIHNASLIHDDIIDKALKRHNKDTFHQKYNNHVSVIIGDYLFAGATEFINKLEDSNITNMISDTMKTMCNGEIYQYFNKGKIYRLEDYIEKSYKKTGKLFETAVNSAILLTKKDNLLSDFGKNFGTAFQIKDDYNNIYNDCTNIDIKDKVYTAPIIFAQKDYPDIADFEENKILEIVKQDKYRQKTEELIKKYVNKAIENLNILQDNEYKKALIILCKYIEEG